MQKKMFFKIANALREMLAFWLIILYPDALCAWYVQQIVTAMQIPIVNLIIYLMAPSELAVM